MDIPLRTDALRSIDTESRPGVDARNPADAGDFGEMFAEVRQRDIDSDEERDTPPPGTEAAFVGQTVPLPPKQTAPATDETPADSTAEAETATAVAAAGGKDGGAATSEALTAPAASATSPESFAALLESSASGLTTATLQTPSGEALAAIAGATPVTTPATPVAVPPPVTATIAAPLQSPAWPAAFNNTMRVLVTDQTQVARLQLTPGDLGPVDVRIAISEHRAEIAFAVSSPEAKAAIQQALPQLRETFAAGGLQLGDASFSESPRGGGNEAAPGGAGWPENGRMTGETAAPLPATRNVGLIDLYA